MIFYSISDDDAFAPAAASRKIEKKRKIESSSSSSSFFFSSLSSKPTKVPLTLLLLRTTNKATTFGRESSEALFVTNRFLPQKFRVYNPKQERGRKMAREKRKNFQNPRERYKRC